MTFVGPYVFSADSLTEQQRIAQNQIQDELLYERFDHLTRVRTAAWQNQTLQLLNTFGVVTSRTRILSLSHWLSLWGMSNLDTLQPDFEILSQKIHYWQIQLGSEGLNVFIQNTGHTNPYHLMAIDLERWQAMTKFMTTVGLFSEDPTGPRSLYGFLATHSWAEGAVTSRKAEPRLWSQWTDLFKHVLQNSSRLSDYFSAGYYENSKNHDFLQRVYISLTKDLYNAVKDYQHLLTPQILIDFIDPAHTYMHSSFTSDLQDTLELLNQMILTRQKVHGVLMTPAFAKNILLDLLGKVYSDSSLTRSGPKFQNAIYEIHTAQSQNMCHQFLSR